MPRLARTEAGVKILACGSRNVEAFACFDWWCDRLSSVPSDSTVISGGARGVDTFAHRAAKSRGLRTQTFRADWKKHGRRAGIIRNLQMLDEQPDLVIAYWDGLSHGTQHTIHAAQTRGIPVEIHDALQANRETVTSS